MAAEREAVTYAHRNGETEPPTHDGAFYWFCDPGWIDHAEGIAGILFVYEDAAYGPDRYEFAPLSALKGRWWGPVMSPWSKDT